jgi:hypothetical protein
MLDITEYQWNNMNGGYKTPYNPNHIFDLLSKDISSVEAWDLIWENLHHQGDIGEASYAIIPKLVDLYKKSNSTDWQVYSYVSLIIQESHRNSNPKTPDWLKEDFSTALANLFEMALSDLKISDHDAWTSAIVGFVLMYKGLIKQGTIVSSLDQSEIDEIADEKLDWNSLYWT